jgi:CubicO group peptidase (beta-lactamase class C family)
MRRAIRKDENLLKKLDESVRKVLNAKFDATLYKKNVINTENLIYRLNTPSASLLQTALLEKPVTLVKDDLHLLPIKQIENKSFASLTIGAGKNNFFTDNLDKYSSFTHYRLQITEDTTQLTKQLLKHTVIIAGVYPGASNIENLYPEILQQLSKQAQLIVVELESPSKISLIGNLPVILQAYTDHPFVQKFVPQLIFGAAPVSGTLPIPINATITEGQGIMSAAIGRLGYATPEAVGISNQITEKINLIIQEAIDKKVAPGCQVIVARRGKIVYEKSAGWQTYDNKTPISDQSIYDLASVTKVAATLQTTMFLYEKCLLDIYKKASYYLPELLTSNKKDLIVKDILTHQAGLTPFVPFWIQTVKDADFLPQYYSRVKSNKYPLQIAPNLYGIKSLRDSLWSWSIKSKLREKPPRTPYNYVYSDIGLYILFHLNEKLLNQPQEEFLQQNLYEPLGAPTMGYLPLERFSPNRIVPTEVDSLFRKSLLLGTVHDEGAAMLGGVAGHAGLFSSAIDLTKLGQMLLQNGYYGGLQYFKPETVQYFTTKQFETSRRGLGWDKPVQSEWNSPTSLLASPLTFGHTGFTGTCIWVDPEFELVYVFLSNRVYPNRSNNKLSALNIRSRIQDMIYQSIFNYGQYGPSQSEVERYLKSKANKPY